MIEEKIVSVTGHRPDKLGNEYDMKGPMSRKIYDRLCHTVEILKPTRMISGMALGVDMIFANLAINKGIPFTAAIPFHGQEKTWPEQSQKLYRTILKYAFEVVIVSEGGYSASKMQKRNKWMIDKSGILIAVWDGTPGGTSNAYHYAKDQVKEIIRIDPREL
jgi:uncharacterized phage-like protein YoqJ